MSGTISAEAHPSDRSFLVLVDYNWNKAEAKWSLISTVMFKKGMKRWAVCQPVQIPRLVKILLLAFYGHHTSFPASTEKIFLGLVGYDMENYPWSYRNLKWNHAFIWGGSVMWFLCVCSHRFNHELVFGVSVKNLSKAERLIYGDSLMTHAMILTAVTDKVPSHKHTTQVGDCSVNSHSTYTSRLTGIHTFRVSQGLLHQSLASCLRCFNRLQFLIVMSISPLVSNPSC